jgi:uncharacterized protein YggE
LRSAIAIRVVECSETARRWSRARAEWDTSAEQTTSTRREIIMRKSLGILSLFLIIACSAPVASAQRADVDDVPALLDVSGRGVVEVEPDQAKVEITVIADGDDSSAAMRSNSRIMAVILEAVHEIGIEEKEYETGTLAVSPRFSTPPKDRPDDWVQEVIGSWAVNSIVVKTGRLELAPRIIQAASDAGATEIELSYGLAEGRPHFDEALRLAMHDATRKARLLADAASVRLERLVYIGGGDTPWTYAMYDYAGGGGGANIFNDSYRFKDPDPPAAPGKIEVEATVDLQYEISDLRASE